MFYGGELYGITRQGKSLLRFEIRVNDDGEPLVTATHQLAVQRREGPGNKSIFEYDVYLFELHGKLAMAVMNVWSRTGMLLFRVYKLTDVSTVDSTHRYKWSEVHSLGAYALFLGPRCSSKVVHVPADGRGGVEKNHIY